jgi:plasmid replication initiation protein
MNVLNVAKKERSESLIVKSNAIINAKYNFTLNAERLFLKLVSMIDRKDNDFKEYRIAINDIIGIINYKGKSLSRDIRKACYELRHTEINVDKDGEWEDYNLASKSAYEKGGFVVIRFEKELKPFFLKLKKNFTKYQIQAVMRLKSRYHIRLYELLKEYEYKGYRDINLDELKEKLGIKRKYKEYRNFKNRVLLPSKKEMAEKTDLTFDFYEIRLGRQVSGIKFKIIKVVDTSAFDESKMAEQIQIPFSKESLHNNENEDVQLRRCEKIVRTHIFKEHQERVLKKYSPEYILHYYSYAKKNRPQNIGNLMYVSMINDRDNFFEKKRLKDEMKLREKKERIQIEVEKKKESLEKELMEISKRIFNLLLDDIKDKYLSMVEKRMPYLPESFRKDNAAKIFLDEYIDSLKEIELLMKNNDSKLKEDLDRIKEINLKLTKI